jgi:hypothetical protein
LYLNFLELSIAAASGATKEYIYDSMRIFSAGSPDVLFALAGKILFQVAGATKLWPKN